MVAALTGSSWTVLVDGERTSGGFAVVESRETRGAEPPRHLHAREDEFVYVLDGHVTFAHAGELFERPAGTWMFLPRGVEHAFFLRSDSATLLSLFSPAGLEASVTEQPRPDEGPRTVEQIVTAAARYGVSITGPRVSPAPQPIAR